MSLAASPSYLQSKPATKKGLAVPTILAVILATILALTTVVFYSQYENQANINSQQRQLENGVPISARNSCFSSNFENNHPSNADFYSLLPKSLQNETIGGYGLVTLWPVPVNSNNFHLYEVWNVTFLPHKSTPSPSPIEMLFIVNC